MDELGRRVRGGAFRAASLAGSQGRISLGAHFLGLVLLQNPFGVAGGHFGVDHLVGV
jgi:hypothetical protein